MACPDCGSPQGTNLFPCKACVDRRVASRNERREKAKKFEAEEHEKAEKVFDGDSRKLYLLITACTLSAMLILFVMATRIGPVRGEGALAALIYAGAISGTLLFIVGWALIWRASKEISRVFRIICVILPPLAYVTVVLRWKNIHAAFLTNIIGLLMWFGCTIGLALYLQLTFVQTVTLFADFRSGRFFGTSIEEISFGNEPESFSYEEYADAGE